MVMLLLWMLRLWVCNCLVICVMVLVLGSSMRMWLSFRVGVWSFVLVDLYAPTVRRRRQLFVEMNSVLCILVAMLKFSLLMQKLWVWVALLIPRRMRFMMCVLLRALWCLGLLVMKLWVVLARRLLRNVRGLTVSAVTVIRLFR